MGEPAVSAAPPDVNASPRCYRVLCVATHPVQYAAPLFRRMANHSQLDLTVAYCSLQGAQAGYDPEFGTEVKWDIPLLDGYSWTEMPNRSLRPGLGRFFGLVNPGLWTLIRRGRFDAVIIHTGYVYATFWIGLLAAKLSRVPILFGTDAVSLQPRVGGSWKRVVKRVAWPLLFRLADQVLTLSTGGRELMLSLGIPEDRVSLTPYVVDNDWWIARSAQVNRAAVRTTWQVTPEQPVILFCAKLQPWKRPLDLLVAFARVDDPSAVLVFAGEGPLRGQIEAKASALGVQERIRMLGFVNQSQLPGVYSAADVLILSSQYEAFGVVVNEAMLSGRPVIASDRVGATRDLIIPGCTGFVYPCGDTAALAEILREVIGDSGHLVEMGRAARERMTSWSPQENIAATVDAIARAVARLGRNTSRRGPRDRSEDEMASPMVGSRARGDQSS
ncbi:MAG: glycosyltransferase [Candidatus Acidiferrales bacterium]